MEKKYFVSDIIAAIVHRELSVYYQPKYDATTNRMKSAEALVRWIKKDGSVILPERFLHAMEQSDAITMLDWYVVEEVCAFLERLKGEGIRPLPVSVNFSRWHLHEEDAARRLSDILDAHRLDHSLIVVEITESAMIDEEERMRAMVDGLHAKGFDTNLNLNFNHLALSFPP